MENLQEQLLDARRRVRLLTQDISGPQLLGPRLAIVNPFLWELGHVAWFQERWCLRTRDDGMLGASLADGADALYDSSRVPHDTRWDLPLPDLRGTLDYQDRVLERVLARLERDSPNERLGYFVQLAVFHEDMHAEAFHYMRQTLRYGEPAMGEAGMRAPEESARGDVKFQGGEFRLGAEPRTGFVFDNEKWAHPVLVLPFRIARTAVTNREFAEFVDDGGYGRREFWSSEGWAWKEAALASSPRYWAKQDGVWLERRFDRRAPVRADAPVLHVNWFEAEAYCRFSGRRLPTEAEWEYAACAGESAGAKRKFPWGNEPPLGARANLGSGSPAPVGAFPMGDTPQGCRQMIGNVWEWTASTFLPYPAFVRDPYAEYSEPWFGTRKVLRGGSFATPGRLIRNTWRNFFTPDRADVFAGFRTCAIDE